MNKNLLVILLSFLPFLGLFAHQYLIGFDTYNYLQIICHGNSINPIYGVEKAIFGMLPCDFLILKLFLFALQAISLYAIIKTGDFLHQGKGWLVGLLVFLSPIWFLEFATLENDQIAYPFCFLSLFLLIKWLKNKNKVNLAFSGILLAIAGFIWQGAIIFLIAFVFLEPLFLLPVFLAILLFWPKLPGLLGGTGAVESQFGFGIVWLGPLFLGLFNPKKWLWLPTIVLLIFIIFNAKFSILIVPFLAIGLLEFFEWITPYNPNYFGLIKKLAILFCIFCLFTSAYSIYTRSPTPKELVLVKEYLDYKPKIEHQNDWSFGYFIQWLGGKPSSWAGGKWNEDYNGKIALVYDDLNCNLINQAGEIKLYDCYPGHY